MSKPKRQHLKQRKDGRYCCIYHGKQFMGKTEQEALAARAEYVRSLRQNRPSTAFSSYALTWLQAYKNHLTQAPYNAHVRNINRFSTIIKDKPLEKVTPSDIARYYQLFAGMSRSTINSARDTIKGIFKAALADGMIDKDPTTSVQPPKGPKGTHRAITPEERQLIHETPHRLRPAVLVMLYAGLRRGEAIALDIDRDIDFKKMCITVRQAVRFDRQGQPEIVSPKTEAGTRTVPLLAQLADELRPLHGLLCQSASGQMMTEAAWVRAWNSYLYALGEKKNGCSKRWSKDPWQPVTIRAHDLRHSYCTMLYDAGIDLKTAMLWMGHADQSMTMQIYTHLTEQRRTEAENTLRNAVKNSLNMQNDMQKKSEAPEALKIQGS